MILFMHLCAASFFLSNRICAALFNETILCSLRIYQKREAERKVKVPLFLSDIILLNYKIIIIIKIKRNQYKVKYYLPAIVVR